MTVRPLIAARALVTLAAASLALAGCSGGGGEPEAGPLTSTGPPELAAGLGSCAGLAGDEAGSCYAEALAAAVRAADDPLAAVEEAAAAAYADPDGYLLSHCHGLMHTVGREYARDRGVTLATLMDHLPRTNDPGCSAGFAHGLVTGVAPQIDLRRPGDSAEVCAATATRYQRYSCVHGFGHAFMRLAGEELAEGLELCRALGPRDAPDCAQGAFHDYWFAVAGADDTERPPTVVDEPRALCAEQPRDFVRQCWYRAFLEARPDEPVTDAAAIEELCAGLAGLQREGCVTGAAVIGPPDPRAQLGICTRLAAADAPACVRGTKVQNLLDAAPEDLVALIRQCDGFSPDLRPSCYRWLGTALTVLTDGEFERSGCPALPDAAARRACAAGARESDGALVTFS